MICMIYTIGKFILKGVAFPVCISVNEFVCHCSPLETEEGVSSLYASLLHKYSGRCDYLCVYSGRCDSAYAVMYGDE